jgi:HK97 gp10 family phage protein
MDVQVSITGLESLEKALENAGPKLAKAALRKGLKAAAQPLIDAAKSAAPVMTEGTPQRRPGELRDSIGLVTKLSSREENGTAHIGPMYDKKHGSDSPGVWGKFVEFGSIHNPQPNPFMRRAFDAAGKAALDKFSSVMKEALPVLESKR